MIPKEMKTSRLKNTKKGFSRFWRNFFIFILAGRLLQRGVLKFESVSSPLVIARLIRSTSILSLAV